MIGRGLLGPWSLFRNVADEALVVSGTLLPLRLKPQQWGVLFFAMHKASLGMAGERIS